jgi:cytochrome c553
MRFLAVLLFIFVNTSYADNTILPINPNHVELHQIKHDKITGRILFSYCTQCHSQRSSNLKLLYGKTADQVYVRLKKYLAEPTTVLDSTAREHLTDQALYDLANYLSAKK